MSSKPKALCVIGEGVDFSDLTPVIRNTDYDWSCILLGELDTSSRPSFPGDCTANIGDVENPLQPVNWFNQRIIDSSQRLLAWIRKESPEVCWIVGNAGFCLVPLQARATEDNHSVRKYLFTPMGGGASSTSFPDSQIEEYAEREALRMVDVRLDGIVEITGLLSRWANELCKTGKAVGETDDNPLVTVCIPHYNYGAFLEEQLSSLHKQTYKNFEVFVIDDGSNDSASLQVWDQLPRKFPDRRFNFVRCPKNKGLSMTRNEAASRAGGEWLLFCDADNRCYPGMIEKMVRAAQRSGSDVISCYNRQFNLNTDGTEKTTEYYTPLGGAVELGWYANVFGDANALVRKRVFEAAGGFRSMPGLTAEDWELWARIVWSGGKLAVIPTVLFDYRVHSSSVVRTSSWKESVARVYRVYLEQADQLENEGQRQFWTSMISALPEFENWKYERDLNWQELISLRKELVIKQKRLDDLEAQLLGASNQKREKSTLRRIVESLRASFRR